MQGAQVTLVATPRAPRRESQQQRGAARTPKDTNSARGLGVRRPTPIRHVPLRTRATRAGVGNRCGVDHHP